MSHEVPELFLIFQDPSASGDILSHVAQTAVITDDSRAIQPIIDRLINVSDPHWIRRDLTLALGGLHAKVAEDFLKRLLRSEAEHTDVRRAAILALGMIRANSIVDELSELITTGDWPQLVYPSVVALGDIADERGIEPLIVALKSDEPLVPQTAARILGEFGKSARPALAQLQELAQSRSDIERRAALEAIAKID